MEQPTKQPTKQCMKEPTKKATEQLMKRPMEQLAEQPSEQPTLNQTVANDSNNTKEAGYAKAEFNENKMKEAGYTKVDINEREISKSFAQYMARALQDNPAKHEDKSFAQHMARALHNDRTAEYNDDETFTYEVENIYNTNSDQFTKDDDLEPGTMMKVLTEGAEFLLNPRIGGSVLLFDTTPS